jgi:Kef-type K+ transport system membrane component KefB
LEHSLVSDIAICIIAAWVIAVLSQLAKQPLLLAYLAAGFIVGPHAGRLVTDVQSIETISSIGLSLLLFMIGLEIDLRKMLSAGRVITVTALAQIAGGVFLGWAFFVWVGPAATKLEAFYLAVAAAMSSTVIIVKILHDKRELETLAGRVTLGIMVLQDLATILFLAVQPNLKDPSVGMLLVALRNVGILIIVAFVVSRYVLPPLFKFVARQPELVLVGALAWCFSLAGLAGELGLSREMGALIAGMMISTFPYTLDVVAKVTSLRDFFVTLFFVGLGLKIPLPTWNYLFGMLSFSLFLVGSRLLTIFPPLYKMRQGFRVSLLPAINLCQLSELSLVLLMLGVNSGDVSAQTLGMATFAFAFLAIDSTYAILKNDLILAKATPWLKRLGFRDLDHHQPKPDAASAPKRICLLGCSWTASSLLAEITREKPALLKDILVVDFNPQVYEQLRRREIHVIYGDIARREVLHHAGISHAEIIICSLPNSILKGASNLKILRQVRELNATAQIVAHAELITDIAPLYAAGANYVSVPRLLEATDLLKVLEAAEHNLLDEKRQEQADRLTDRPEVIS